MTENREKKNLETAKLLTGLCESIGMILAASSKDEKDLADGLIIANRATTNFAKAYFEEKQKRHGGH
jgi:tRNA-binding EMAP/Myf-like protein